MADVVFAEQRGTSGEYYFAEQFVPPNLIISANADSFSSVQAALNFVAAEFFANASSESTVQAALTRANVFIRASAQSSSTASGDLSKYKLLYASAESGSNVVATLDFVNVGEANIAAIARSESTALAKLYASVSNIPKNARVKAVPVQSETLQLTRFRGDTYADSFLVFDDRTGLALDITGCKFRMALSAVKNPNTHDDLLYTLFGEVEDPSSGLVYFSPSEGQADQVGFFYYDMEMTDSKGVVKTLVSSTYVYQQDITK